MKKLIFCFMASILIFSSLPFSAFAAGFVPSKTYFQPFRDEYRVDYALPTYSYSVLRLDFTDGNGTPYFIELTSPTGIMYLTCNGEYYLRFMDASGGVISETSPIITTEIVTPTCSSYNGQEGTNDLNANQTDNGNGTYDLNWTADPNAATYEVWKNGVKVGETTGTNFTLDGQGSVSIVSKDASGNTLGISDMQVPTYTGSSWGEDPCNACQKLRDMLTCPEWSTYMNEWETMLGRVIPPPPDWNVVSQIFVNAFDNYFGVMPTAPTVAEIETITNTPLPTIDNSFDSAENLVPTVPIEYNSPIDFDLSTAPVISVVDDSQPFIIADPLQNLVTSPVGVGVIPGDPTNSSGDITQPQTIPGLIAPTPTITPSADPVQYVHSDIPVPTTQGSGTTTGPTPGTTSSGTGPIPGSTTTP